MGRENVVCPLSTANLCESVNVPFAVSLFGLVIWVLVDYGDRVGGDFQVRYNKVGGLFRLVINGCLIIRGFI